MKFDQHILSVSSSLEEYTEFFEFEFKFEFASLYIKFIYLLSQTLFGNPKGPVKLGNPNTCAKTKLCLNFSLLRLKK